MREWIRHRAGLALTIGLNSASLVGTTAVTSLLGAAYWWLAARRFSPASVGVAGAAVSAMTLIGVIATVGLTTALIPELGTGGRGRRTPLITAALAVVTALGLVLGIVWQLVAGRVSPDLTLSGSGPLTALLFAVGVGLTALTLVLDQALVGVLRSELQLVRNTAFAAAKLVALAVVALLPEGRHSATLIYATWCGGQVISLAVLVPMALRIAGRRALAPPRLRALRGLRRVAIAHHLFNLLLSAPSWILPLIATAAVSATANAYFYTAWTMAGLVYAGPLALTMVLFALGRRPGGARGPLVLTLALSTAWGAASLAGCALLAFRVLELYGATYAANSTPVLFILCLAVFPQVVKCHYIALIRLRGRLGSAILVFTGFGALELGLAVAGALRHGVQGLAVGWVIAVCVEAVAVLPVLVRALRSPAGPEDRAEEETAEPVEARAV